MPRTRVATAHGGCDASPTGSDRWLEQGHDSYVYFNNDHQGHAAVDATWLSERLDERGRG